MIRILEVAHGEIEPFMEREWQMDNDARSPDLDQRVDWEPRRHCLAAYEDEELVGSAVYRIRGGVAHLGNLIIAHLQRGRGIGGALVDEFIRRAEEAGCHKLTLTTDRDQRAVRFYGQHGFTVEAVFHNDAYHLERCQMALFFESPPDRG